MAPLRLGTRGSQLAMHQARTVARLLQERAGAACEIRVIKTAGDRLQEAPLSEVGGKRLFVKEIEDALLGGEVDLAVHSSKDMPAVPPDGLIVGAVLPREDARDAVVLPLAARKGPPYEPRVGPPFTPHVGRPFTGRQAGPEGPPDNLEELIGELGRAPRIGTSSVRRTAQLLRLLPGARFLPIRGNLDTRLRKLDAGEYDALVLAAAGLNRLEQHARISALLPPEVCVPAPGQGIIAIEVRGADTRVRAIVRTIDDETAAAALTAERAVVVRLGGGCQMPIGAYATIQDGRLTLTAVVVSVDGTRAAHADATGSVTAAARVGEEAAALLLERGAGEILRDVERARAAVEGLQP
jgi:hydroxymethylbilane synthase